MDAGKRSGAKGDGEGKGGEETALYIMRSIVHSVDVLNSLFAGSRPKQNGDVRSIQQSGIQRVQQTLVTGIIVSRSTLISMASGDWSMAGPLSCFE